MHDIYAEWRQVFNEYDPPRAGVAEAWVHPSRRPKYASPDGLGQAFNFDLLEANWNAGEFLRIITDNLSDAQRQGSSTTWVLSNHDVVRHATRYGLPPEEHRGHQNARNWLLSGGTSPRLERGLGLRRARAAVLIVLALPGSAYLYQGEELGLHEVPDIPAELVQDPSYARSQGAEKGRDGCRVPLPWTSGGPSFGFGAGAAHLPQPAWFGPFSVQAQERDPASTLMLYRQALSWRRKLQTAESMDWMPGTNGQVLHFARPGGWRCVTNFGPGPVPLPHGTVILTSVPVEGSQLPADTTAWHPEPLACAPVSSPAPRVLITRSAVIPACSARTVPFASQSSWPGACASVSMANRQPASAASRSSRPGGSRRSGRQLISTATPASRQAPNTASGSKTDSGRRPRPPPSSRPVQ